MNRIWLCLVIVFIFSTVVRGYGDDLPSQGAENENGISLDDVIVRGEGLYKDLEASSATVLTSEDIANRVYVTPLDIVGLAPGISINQYKQGGTASSFQMRGFTRCSHGSDVAIYMDGIPLNEGDGYADTNVVNPDEIERVELIKGPVSSLYGNFASAGVLHFYTQKKVDHQHFKLQYGSYNTEEVSFLGGFTSDNAKWDHVQSIQTYHTDGYQDNSDWDKLNAATRITHHFSDALDIRLSLRAFNSDWDAPGWQNEDEYDNDPEKCVNAANGGSKDRLSEKVELAYRINNQSKLLFHLWSYDQNFKRYYAGREDGVAVGENVGNLRDFDRLVWGNGISYNVVDDVHGRNLRFTVGMDYMDESIERDRWRLTAGNGRNKGEQYIDYHINFETASFYAEANCEIIDHLRLILGGRYDHFSGDLTDHLLNEQESTMSDTDIFSPKGGFVYSMVDDKVALFGNFGRGFAIMAGFAEQAQFTQEDWDPQLRDQYEVGTRATLLNAVKVQLIYFRLETEDDFIQNPETLDYINAGETLREGVELAVDYNILDFGYVHADYAYVDATYETYASGGIRYDGNDIPGVPDTVVNAELGYNPPDGFGGWIRYHHQSGGKLDEANTVKGESWGKADANIFYRFGDKQKYMAAIDIINLFDVKYPETQSYWSGSTSYSPGLPFSLYVSLTVNY